MLRWCVCGPHFQLWEQRNPRAYCCPILKTRVWNPHAMCNGLAASNSVLRKAYFPSGYRRAFHLLWRWAVSVARTQTTSGEQRLSVETFVGRFADAGASHWRFHFVTSRWYSQWNEENFLKLEVRCGIQTTDWQEIWGLSMTTFCVRTLRGDSICTTSCMHI